MSRLAILRSGERVLIRPIRKEDKEVLLEGFHRLSAESQYRRFFSPKPKLSAAPLRYLTEVDHRTHEALVAIDPNTREGIGVARFIRSSEHATDAEAAVAVIDPWQDRGVGTVLLEELAARAREESVERFPASVLVSNSPMLQLLRPGERIEVARRLKPATPPPTHSGDGVPDEQLTVRHGSSWGRCARG